MRAARHADRSRGAREPALAATRRAPNRSRSSTGRTRTFRRPGTPSRAGGADVELRGRARAAARSTSSRIRSRRGACSTRSSTASRRAREAPWQFAMAERAARCAGRRDRRVPHADPAPRTASSSCRRTAPPATRRASASALDREGYPDAAATAAWMRAYGAAKTDNEARQSTADAGTARASGSTSGCGPRGSTGRAAWPRRRSTPARCASTASASSLRIRCAPATRVERAQAGLTWDVEVTGVDRRGGVRDRRRDALPRNAGERRSRARKRCRSARLRAQLRRAARGPADQARPAQARGLPERAVAVSRRRRGVVRRVSKDACRRGRASDRVAGTREDEPGDERRPAARAIACHAIRRLRRVCRPDAGRASSPRGHRAGPPRRIYAVCDAPGKSAKTRDRRRGQHAACAHRGHHRTEVGGGLHVGDRLREQVDRAPADDQRQLRAAARDAGRESPGRRSCPRCRDRTAARPAPPCTPSRRRRFPAPARRRRASGS